MIRKFPFRQVVVVGGTGLTGHRVIEFLVSCEDVKIVATSRAVSGQRPAGPLASTVTSLAQQWGDRVAWEALDFEAQPAIVAKQLEAVQKHFDAKEPTAVVIAAAFTNVEGCEENPEKNERINISNTVQTLDWGRRLGAHLVFYSTDYVFDGTEGPYSEEHPRRALSRYGQAKVQVEEWLESNASSSALVLRTTGVYDAVPGSKNFLMQMLEAWGQGRQTRIPSDQWANPVWATELAKATVELLALKAAGIYHVAGGQFLPRHQFAQVIADVFGYDRGLIIPIDTSELKQKAQRPLKGGLRCEKLKQKLGWAPGSPETILGLLKCNQKQATQS